MSINTHSHSDSVLFIGIIHLTVLLKVRECEALCYNYDWANLWASYETVYPTFSHFDLAL